MVRGIRPLAAGAVLLLLTACASATTTISSAASCTAMLHFRGHIYYGQALKTSSYTQTGRVPKAHMHVIGTGILPACRDTNHSANDHDLSVPVARIDGVDPGTAVAQYPWGLVYVHKLSPTTS
jgi:hypothetical protein